MNSVLNPEAPEFYPHLTSVTQVGYVSVNKSIKSSNNLPKGPSYGFFKTYTEFHILTCQLSENVVLQSNQIIATEIPGVKLKRNDLMSNSDKIEEVNDNIMDRVYINIDTATGVNEPSEKFIKGIQWKKPLNVSPWNATPVIAKIQLGSTTFIGAKNILRPQLMFKDQIDNSDNLWVPKISDKPNSIKPLALNILYNDEGEAVGYEHPYKIELDLYTPPSQFMEPDVEPFPFPAALEDTNFSYIDTESKLDALVEHLNTVTEMAIDVEHHSYRTYQGITCLIQVSTVEGGDFIIDTLAVREHVHKLNLAFTDPKKIKILHGADYDVIWLQRDFGVYLVGLFDTHQAAKLLNLHKLSLKYLLTRYCRVDADKKYQLADWRMRPLPEELIQYARMDTHYLLYIWHQMKEQLLAYGEQSRLQSVFENSRHICLATYNKKVVNDMSHLSLYGTSTKTFNSQQMAALKMLFKWRDEQARALDESTGYLLPNHMLLTLAEQLPRELQGVNAICVPMPPFVKQNLIDMHKMILSCRELPCDAEMYTPQTAARPIIGSTKPKPRYLVPIHDWSQYADLSDEAAFDEYQPPMDEYNYMPPTIEAFMPPSLKKTYGSIVSDLNADAQLFIPPYDRYRIYRSLVQDQEMKSMKEKEAKVAALSKGNRLIQVEVLGKLQQAQTQIVNDEMRDVMDFKNDENDHSDKKTQHKKQNTKGSIIKGDPKQHVEAATKVVDKKPELNKTKNSVKPYDYKNINSNKFYTNKEHKQKQFKIKNKKK